MGQVEDGEPQGKGAMGGEVRRIRGVRSWCNTTSNLLPWPWMPAPLRHWNLLGESCHAAKGRLLEAFGLLT